MKLRIVTFLAVLVFCLTASGAITYNAAYYLDNIQWAHSGNTSLDPVYLNVNEVATILGAAAGTATANKAAILGATNNLDVLTLGSALLTPGTAPTGALLAEGRIYMKASDHLPYYYNGSTWVALGTGSFTGGTILTDITLSDDVDILPTTTITDTFSIQVRDTDASAYLDVLRWTNATTPTIVLGHDNASFALASTGMDVSTGGAVTGVSTLTASGAVISGGLTTTGNTAIGDGTGSFAVSSTGVDITTGGAVSGVTTLAMTDDLSMATGKGIKSSTTNTHTVGVYGYDTDGEYVGALVITNSATPATVLGNSNGTTAISSADWTIGTTGNMAGIGTITSNGLITATAGLTLTGTTSINDTATTSTTSIGGGTTTGTITIGGTGEQAIDIGNGAGIKTVALGSTNTTSTTTIKGGSNGVNINVGTFDDPTNINTGVNTGTVTIGGTGAMSIAIGDGGTGAKTITIGDAASSGSTVIKAGTGNLDLSSVDDVSLNGGSIGSIIGIGQNTHGNIIRIGTDDSSADSITIGSASDTTAIAGISLTLGSTGNSSATAIQSGSGEVKINESINQPVSIATGTSTGTVTIGTGDTAQTVSIANGAGAKTVALGSSNTTSATTILGGSNGVNIAHGAYDDPVNIAGGTSTGTVTIGGTGTQTISIGNGAGAKAVNLGSATGASATVISSGTGDLDINAAGGNLDLDAAGTLDILAAGAFSIDGSNAASNISLATNSAGDDFTIAITGATDSSLVLSSTGTGADAIYIRENGGTGAGIKIHADQGTSQQSVHILTDGGGVTIQATSIIDDGALLYVTGTVATGNELWGGVYADINIDGTTDGAVYAVSGILWPQATSAPASLTAGAKFGINAASGDLSGATVAGIVIENLIAAGCTDPGAQYMMYFNCTETGDVPDAWFRATSPNAVAWTSNSAVTGTKNGAIKCSIGGTTCYIWTYDDYK